MKNLFIASSLLIILTLSFLSCSSGSDDQNILQDDILQDDITKQDETFGNEDKDALLFMLEEEKLARDTYTFLGDLWSINQFNNIKQSEQTHMNAIVNLLESNDIEYTILPYGEFNNQELQVLYNEFKTNGTTSKSKALQIGATIEDLDIIDLQNFIDKMSNSSIISVFKSLQCGSRNHLRSFVKAIEMSGDTYTPQYLSVTEYSSIINGSQEKCGQ